MRRRCGGGVDSETRLVFLLVPLGIALVGAFFFVTGIVLTRRERAFQRVAVDAQGVVTGFERRRITRRRFGTVSRAYHDFPVVRYTTREGREVQFTSPIGTSPRIHREGQTVPVLYDPSNPTDARLASGLMRYGLSLFFLLFGLGMLLFAACFASIAWFAIRQVPAT